MMMAFKNDEDKKAYWKANLSLMAKLLSVWFVVSFGFGILFVDELNTLRVFGFKLGFWFAQQGAIYVFVALIFIYMHQMNKLDKRFGVDEE
jgi:putative solute:sodium symporter small subunit